MIFYSSRISILLLFFSTIIHAQTREFSGIIKADGNVEGVHVINKTAYRYATTNQKGEFTIKGKLSDSLYFSSIQYMPKFVVITAKMIENNFIEVTLEDSVTELDEVTVGKILTGDLNSDITNSDAERPLDFYDVGIPGYTGVRKTQAESRVYEADYGKMVYLGFPYVMFNFNKFLNKVDWTYQTTQTRCKVRKGKEYFDVRKRSCGPRTF